MASRPPKRKRGVTPRLTKRNLKKAYPSNRKERGEWVELLFMATAARLGLKVMRPHGDSARFDVVVEDSGGKLHRVQVKSTTARRKGAYECHCSWKTTTPMFPAARDNNTAGLARKLRARQYSKEDIDFVAAYIVPEDAWFIVPASSLPTTALYLPRREKAGRSRYGPFLEAWHLLGADGTGLTIYASAESVQTDMLLALLKAKVRDECSW